MKKRNAMLITLAAVLIFGIGVPLAYQNSSFLQGAFPITPGGIQSSSLCPTSIIKTIYVSEGAAPGGAGTLASPYDSLSSVQTALEADARIKRVCVSGSLTGTLSLNASLGRILTVTAYTAGSSLNSTGLAIQQEIGVLEKLSVTDLAINGLMRVSPATLLNISDVDMDGGGTGASALWISSTDTVTIEDSQFSNAYIGLDTSHQVASSVGSLSLNNVSFDDVSKGLEAYYVTSLEVKSSSFSYDEFGIESERTISLLIEKSNFSGDNNGSAGLIIINNTALVSNLDFKNNFVTGNRDAGIVSNTTTNVAGVVANNSFYNNRIASTLNTARGNTDYENNIIFANPSQVAFGATTMSPYMTSDYNLFYGDVSYDVAKLGDWQLATGDDMNSIEGDPLFISTTDLHISASSPAVDAGTTTAVTDDIDGDARSGSYDIGADEL